VLTLRGRARELPSGQEPSARREERGCDRQ
jgi:hypothetical protein